MSTPGQLGIRQVFCQIKLSKSFSFDKIKAKKLKKKRVKFCHETLSIVYVGPDCSNEYRTKPFTMTTDRYLVCMRTCQIRRPAQRDENKIPETEKD